MRIGVLPFFPLPRHPLWRALVVVAWVLLFALLAATGLVVGAIVLAVAGLVLLIRRWLGGSAQPVADPDVIEGEFTVVEPRPRASLPPTD